MGERELTTMAEITGWAAREQVNYLLPSPYFTFSSIFALTETFQTRSSCTS